MSFGSSTSRRRRGGVVFTIWMAAGTVLSAADGSPRPGRAIEFSDPGLPMRVTNVNQLSAEKSGTRNFEDEFPSTAAMVPAESSLMGMMPPALPRGPSGGSRRATGLTDQHQNWTLMTPEDMMRDIALKGILKGQGTGPDGEEGQPASTMERLYEGMLFGHGGAANSLQKRDFFRLRKPAEAASDFSLSEELGAFKQDSDSDSPFSPPSAKPKGVLDVFGFGNDRRRNEESPEGIREKEAQAMQMKEYRDLLNGVSGLQPPMPGRASPSSDPWVSSSPVPSADPSQLNPFATAPGSIINPALSPPKVPASPIPSSLSPPRFTTPLVVNSMLMRGPDFSVPRRQF